ncbi:MAG: LamG domain-containing protein [bacterium]|nr:LamG domain-containing protein [bacterium]
MYSIHDQHLMSSTYPQQNIVNGIVFSFVVLLSFFAPHIADAAVIIQRPVYVGLTNGLVGSWSFDGPDMAGNAAYDRSGNNNTGTLTNGPVRGIGKIGQALSFDGVDDRVNIGSSASLNILGDFSFSGWFKANGNYTTAQAFVANSNGQSGNYAVTFALTDNKFEFWNWAGGSNITSTRSISDDNWHHYAATRTGTTGNWTLNLYIDGILDKTETSTTNPAGDSFITAIGRFGEFDGYYLNGNLDDVRIYNRVLSPQEIKRLYNIGGTFKVNAPRYTGSLTSGLVGAWSFDGPDMAGVNAYDRSGSFATGTLTNGPARTVGKIGQALEFDGVDDYVSTTYAPIFADGADFSFTAWVKAPSLANVTADIVGSLANTGISDETIRLIFNASGCTSGKIEWIVRDTNSVSGDDVCSTSSSFDNNVWHHVVGVFDEDVSLYLYVDGVLQGSTAVTNGSGDAEKDFTGYPFYIGARNGQGAADTFLSGSIDDVRIYNRALSADEIKRLYNIGGTFKVNAPRYTDSLTNGLVGAWSFDGPDMAGVQAYDRSGSYATGTLTNGPKKTIGKIGQALSFDGVDDYVSVARNSAFEPATAISVATWIYWQDNSASSYAQVVNKPKNVPTDPHVSYGVEQDVGTSNMNFTLNIDSVLYKTGTTPVSLNTWHHLVGTWSSGGKTMRLYLDGVEVATNAGASGSITYYEKPLEIGVNTNTANTEFNGLIDDVRIYNRALSPQEIQRLYNVGR